LNAAAVSRRFSGGASGAVIWSTTALYLGSLFPVGKHVQFNAYYEHENNTGKHLNQQVNAVGLALHVYFSVEE
jgi:hypothetical protein